MFRVSVLGTRPTRCLEPTPVRFSVIFRKSVKVISVTGISFSPGVLVGSDLLNDPPECPELYNQYECSF